MIKKSQVLSGLEALSYGVSPVLGVISSRVRNGSGSGLNLGKTLTVVTPALCSNFLPLEVFKEVGFSESYDGYSYEVSRVLMDDSSLMRFRNPSLENNSVENFLYNFFTFGPVYEAFFDSSLKEEKIFVSNDFFDSYKKVNCNYVLDSGELISDISVADLTSIDFNGYEFFPSDLIFDKFADGCVSDLKRKALGLSD